MKQQELNIYSLLYNAYPRPMHTRTIVDELDDINIKMSIQSVRYYLNNLFIKRIVCKVKLGDTYFYSVEKGNYYNKREQN